MFFCLHKMNWQDLCKSPKFLHKLVFMSCFSCKNCYFNAIKQLVMLQFVKQSIRLSENIVKQLKLFRWQIAIVILNNRSFLIIEKCIN